MKYVYPAVFAEENGGYAVEFPDLEGCVTCGDDLNDAIAMAEDVLSLALVDIEDSHQEIPTPSILSDIKLEDGEFANYIRCDTERYRKLLNNRAVKKTLSIPEWLNESAVAAGINFSQTLQEALMQKLNLG